MIRVSIVIASLLLITFGCSEPESEKCKHIAYAENLEIIKNSNSRKKCLKTIDKLVENHHINSFDIKSVYDKAIELEDEKRIRRLYKYLIEKGIPKSYFYGVSDNDWYDFQPPIKYNYDEVLRNKTIRLRLEDSISNEKYHEWRKGNLEMTKEDLIQDAGEILNQFQQIVSDYGFPSEQRIGYYYNNGEIYDSPVGILLTHIYQRGDRIYFNELDSLLCQGEISSNLYKTLKTIKGFGKNEGYKKEMELRYNMYK